MSTKEFKAPGTVEYMQGIQADLLTIAQDLRGIALRYFGLPETEPAENFRVVFRLSKPETLSKRDALVTGARVRGSFWALHRDFEQELGQCCGESRTGHEHFALVNAARNFACASLEVLGPEMLPWHKPEASYTVVSSFSTT